MRNDWENMFLRGLTSHAVSPAEVAHRHATKQRLHEFHFEWREHLAATVLRQHLGYPSLQFVQSARLRRTLGRRVATLPVLRAAHHTTTPAECPPGSGSPLDIALRLPPATRPPGPKSTAPP